MSIKQTCMLYKQEICIGSKNECINCTDYVQIPTKIDNDYYIHFNRSNKRNFIISQTPLNIPDKRFCPAYVYDKCTENNCDIIPTSKTMCLSYYLRRCKYRSCNHCYIYERIADEHISNHGHYLVCKNYKHRNKK